MALKSVRKSYVTLLEVLIAFFIVAMCIFPLLYPHIAMYKDQAQFIHLIDLDHAVNQTYAEIYQKLQENQIPWPSIEQKQVFPFDLSKSTANPLPYKGQYVFNIERVKKSDPIRVYKVDLIFSLWDSQDTIDVKKPKYEFIYKIFIGRNLGGGNAASS